MSTLRLVLAQPVRRPADKQIIMSDDHCAFLRDFLLAALDVAQAIAVLENVQNPADGQLVVALDAMDNLENAFERLTPRGDAVEQIVIDLCARLHRTIADVERLTRLNKN